MFKKTIIASIVLFSSSIFAHGDNLTSPSALSEQYKIAHEARNYDAISELINWDGVRKPMKKKIEVHTMSTFGMKINDIVIEEVKSEDFQKFTIGNKVLNPNVPVSHIMKIHFDIGDVPEAVSTNDTAVYLLGKQDDHFIISVYVKSGTSASDSQH